MTAPTPTTARIKKHYHYGLVTVSDGKSRPQTARIKLCSESLILQREEFIFPDDDDGGYPVDNKLRTVKLRRQDSGSLGISLKGGTDHNLPILVSKVTTQQKQQKDQSHFDPSNTSSLDHLYIGDAIVKVNHTLMTSVSHEEALEILNEAGDEVTLTVKHYKSAAPFLLKNVRQLIPEQTGDSNSGYYDSRRSSSQGTHPLQSPAGSVTSGTACVGQGDWNGIPRVKRKWVDVIEVPLLLAYITRYIFGTDKLRPNAFEVRGINGSNTGVVHCQDLGVLSSWIKLISDYITVLASQKAAHFNRNGLGPSQQITYMSWVAEGILNVNQPWQNWTPKYFALQGSSVCIFDNPPMVLEDWQEGEAKGVKRYKVYESMFRAIKESEYVDERQHCFLLQTSGQESRYFSMETRQDLLKMESSWHRSVCRTVSQLGSTTFHVVYDNIPAALTLHWTDGFLLKPFASSSYIFNYNFSQLKGSSDDGTATLKLLFQEGTGHSAGLVEQVIICPKLQDLLFFMHAFLTAKVASADPTFMPSSSKGASAAATPSSSTSSPQV